MGVLKLSGQDAMLRFHDLPGSGTPLVFIHGLGCASSCDYPQVTADSALTGRRCILVNLLGSGYSDRPERFEYRVEDHARIVVELIQNLEQEIDLFGHSMGGRLLSSLQRWRLARCAVWFSQSRILTWAEDYSVARFPPIPNLTTY